MNKIHALTATLLLVAAALVAAILGDTSSAAAQKAPKGALISVHKTALGRVLVDGRGHTLYLFEKDKKGMSSCNGACTAYWPAVISAAKPRAGAGVRASLLGGPGARMVDVRSPSPGTRSTRSSAIRRPDRRRAKASRTSAPLGTRSRRMASRSNRMRLQPATPATAAGEAGSHPQLRWEGRSAPLPSPAPAPVHQVTPCFERSGQGGGPACSRPRR